MSNIKDNASIIVLFSGGLDSTVLLYDVLKCVPHSNITALYIKYGSKHMNKELASATSIASSVNVDLKIVDMTQVFCNFKSGLLNEKLSSVNDSVVPFRNMLLITTAAGLYTNQAQSKDLYIAIGAHHSDEGGYRDCREDFFKSLENTLNLGKPFEIPNIYIYYPFINKTKTDVIKYGFDLHIPFSKTWSCYLGGDEPCGICPSCIGRKNAFKLLDVIDIKYNEKDI